VTDALAHLLFFYVTFLVPWFGRFKYRQLQDQVAAGVHDARCHFYRKTIAQQGALAMAVFLIWRLDAVPSDALGLVAPISWKAATNSLILLFLAIAVSIVLVRYKGDRQFKRLQRMAGALLPTSVSERWWFAAISLGAGISEELVCRGFLLFYLNAYAHGLGVWKMIIISSLIFGLGHLYQSWLGVLGGTALGFCFALLYLGSGSLLVPATVHAAVDLRIIAILTPERVKSLQNATRAACAAR
jgi:membrane protease YdiL (CAAX protease family)